jgi:bifunctional enzyme CysN/CysC
MSTTATPKFEQLKIVIVGHVDHGKSTLVGRLFHDTGSLPDGKFDKIKASCEKRGMPFEWAFLMDGLQAERDQNITIDTAQIWFRTPKRQYVIIDAPGHKEFLKNMVTGAANAQAALLLIDANEGVQEQSRRHGFLLSLLGIKQIAVVVNKMDLKGYSQDVFNAIEMEYREFLGQLGITPRLFIPIAAYHGENIATRSTQMNWYSGPTVLEALDQFDIAPPDHDLPLRFPIQDVYRFDARRILAGRVESGTLRVGDRILFSPRNKQSVIKSIERWGSPERDIATAGESVGITLEEQIFVERGQIGSNELEAPIETDVFGAKLFWLGKQKLEVGRKVKLKLTTTEIECQVQSIEKLIDSSTLQELDRARGYIGRNDVAEVTMRTKTPIAFDRYDRIVSTGRFVVVDGHLVCGGGVIYKGEYPDRRDVLSGVKSQNIFWTNTEVTRAAREKRNKHKGAVIWLTGLSGAGKSTIATELERELFHLGLHTYVLDGDNVRHGLSANLGFSPEDRTENIRRVGEVAKLFCDAGTIVITAFISPYRDDRRLARSIMEQAGDFIEIYVNAPVEVCEQRDPKGLYKKARTGQIKQFTGVSAPYEPPEDPQVTVHTDKQTVAESVAHIIDFLKIDHIEQT